MKQKKDNKLKVLNKEKNSRGKNIMVVQKKGWRELTDGAVIAEAGNSKNYKTGDWKNQRPVWDEKKCIHCMTCWIYCPEPCIPAKDSKRLETDLDHCKGCGICAEVCPVKCITMKSENEFK